MSVSVILGCLWVLAATIVALLPMRRQYVPGVSLLIAAPALIAFLGWQHGLWLALIAVLALLSMFRNPLIYFWKRFRRIPVDLPPELRDKSR
ncbi:MAG: DUF2484 family protein [Rhodobacteraceae bacterium]|nr:DUF2484 family protein [Paracoccaceae bacterium]